MMAVSTIDPNQPVANSPLSSSVMRGQFQAAIFDINNIYFLLALVVPQVGVWTANPVTISNAETSSSIRFPSAATVNITLPTAVMVGERHVITDAKGLCTPTNPFIITPLAGLIQGAPSLTLTFNFSSVTVEWDGIGWNTIT